MLHPFGTREEPVDLIFCILNTGFGTCWVLPAGLTSSTTTKPIQGEVNSNIRAQPREVEEKRFLTLSVHAQSLDRNFGSEPALGYLIHSLRRCKYFLKTSDHSQEEKF